MLAALLLVAAPTHARADRGSIDPDPPQATRAEDVTGPTAPATPAQDSGSTTGSSSRPTADDNAPRPAARRGFGGEVRLFGSVHRPAFGLALALDYAWRRAALAVGAELNPYAGEGPGDLVPGALHLFASGEHRIPIGRVVLRQRFAVGPAILLTDALGKPRGAVGLFLEAVPLGLEILTRARRLAVTLDAFTLALSAPVLGDAPLVRYQYRAGGLRF